MSQNYPYTLAYVAGRQEYLTQLTERADELLIRDIVTEAKLEEIITDVQATIEKLKGKVPVYELEQAGIT